MYRIAGVAAFILLTAAAHAQDTTVVIVRHIEPKQDTNVVVRRLAPPPRATVSRTPARYAPNSTGVVAKDPSIGTMLSFVFPGGGQYYAGKQAKGFAITLLSFGAPIIGYASVRRDDAYHSGFGGSDCVGFAATNQQPPPLNGIYCRGRTDWTPAAVGLGVGIVSYLYGVATAGTDVQHWNQAHGVRFVTGPGRMGFALALP